jgi:mRNA-degrading endonuclease toxin of MazEF toxin-antitoxin module
MVSMLDSIALVFQIVALDRDRFQHRIGALSAHQQLAIDALIRDLLELD